MRAEQHQLIDVLARRGAKFVLLGGTALQVYGIDRPTTDVDVLIAAAEPNEELQQALEALDAHVESVGELGTTYVTALGKLDVLHHTSGVGDYEQWVGGSQLRRLREDGPLIRVAGLDDIEVDKRINDREKDREAVLWIERFRIDPDAGSPHPAERLLGPRPEEPGAAQRWRAAGAVVDRFRSDHGIDTEAPLGDPGSLTDEQLAARRSVLAFIEAAGLRTPGLADVSLGVEPTPGDLDLEI